MTGPPLALASISSRYVGGRRLETTGGAAGPVALSGALPRYHHDPNDFHHVEQVYVQRFVPARPRQRTPVLLVHGGGMTGACWETTPDGRPGWLTAFLRARLPVDVLDNVERGRAGWCCLPGVWPGEPIVRGEREMWDTFRIGAPEDYPARVPFAGSRFPLRAFEQMARQSVPRWPGNGELAYQGLLDTLDELGPHVLVAHSQGGGLAARAAAARPGLVRAAVLVEPHGLPRGAPPAGHPPVLTVLGDNIAASALWRELEQAIRAHTRALAGAGATAAILDLPALGITGNSHNPMMDENSDEIAARILDWLDEVRGQDW